MQRQRILVVTASRETASWLSDTLSLAGDQVDAVTDGAAAFQLVWDTDYDVIVCEVGVPGIDGRDLYMAFQNTWPELTRRMVFIGNAPTKPIEDFVARTHLPFVRKPLAPVDVREAVRFAATSPRSRALA